MSALADVLSAESPEWEVLDTARAPLTHWLRLLGAGEPELIALPEALDTPRAGLSNLGLHLPPRWRGVRGAQARDTWFACAAHAAAHLAYSRHRFARGNLKPIQQVLLGLLEDARVERLAWQALPGLRRLWLGFHTARPALGDEVRVLLLRLARALIDDAYEDPHPWLRKGVELFFAADPALGAPIDSPAALRSVASRLGNDLGQMRVQFNAKTYVVEPAYRDDNAWLWSDEPDAARIAEVAQRTEGARRVPGTAAAADAGDEQPAAAPSAAPPPAHESDASLLTRYPEWDHLIGSYRSDWCTLVEAPPPAAQAPVAQAILERRTAVARRLHRLLRNSRIEQTRRLRRQRDGDVPDLDAALHDAIQRRAGRSPDGRVYQRIERRRRDLDVLLLLDLSASTLDPLPASDGTLLDLSREAALLGALTIGLVGDRCAVHGFQSNGRREVRYLRFKDFDEPFDEACRGRIAAMQGQWSTRIGAALRHATRALRARRAGHRLAIVITDGRPYDIDVHEPEYLLEDARRAVLEARHEGVQVLGLTVDPRASEWAERIFGAHRFLALESVDALPAALPALYLRLAHG